MNNRIKELGLFCVDFLPWLGVFRKITVGTLPVYSVLTVGIIQGNIKAVTYKLLRVCIGSAFLF